jgi:hypothetical protein
VFVVKIFFGNRSFALVFLPFIIGGFYIFNHFTNHHVAEEHLNLGFWGKMFEQDLLAFDIAALALIFMNSILINTIFNRNEFMEKNNYLTSMLYVTFMSFFHSFYFLDGLAIAQTLMILMLFQLLKLRQNEDGRRAVFNAAFLFGLACTFFPILLVGTPFLFWTIWVVRPFIFRESLLIITGFTIPMVYAGVHSWVFETKLNRDQFSNSAGELHEWETLVLCSGALLLLFFCAPSLLTLIRQSSIRLKKVFRILLLLTGLCGSIALLEFFAFQKLEAIGLLIFPLMFFLPYAFGSKQPRVVPSMIYYLIFLFSVGKFFIPFDSLGL